MPLKVIEEFYSLRTDRPGQDLERLVAAASNNFWDFDEAYAEILKKSTSGLTIRMEAHPSADK
jgi:hypothetical protein